MPKHHRIRFEIETSSRLRIAQRSRISRAATDRSGKPPNRYRLSKSRRSRSTRSGVGCMRLLGGCFHMLLLSNRQNNCCTAHTDARSWLRGEAGTKQVSLRAVFVPASPRLHSAGSFARCSEGSVPRRRAALDVWNASAALARHAVRDRPLGARSGPPIAAA